jgi:hypothetical protein
VVIVLEKHALPVSTQYTSNASVTFVSDIGNACFVDTRVIEKLLEYTNKFKIVLDRSKYCDQEKAIDEKT